MSTNSSTGPELAGTNATQPAIGFEQVTAQPQHQLFLTSCANNYQNLASSNQPYAAGSGGIWPSQPVCSSLDTQSCGNSSDGSGWNNEIFQAAIQNLDNLSDSDTNSQNCELGATKCLSDHELEGPKKSPFSSDLFVNNYTVEA